MSTREFFIRLFIAMVVFIVCVVGWSFGPIMQGAFVNGFHSGALSIFLGQDKSYGWTAVLLLLARSSIFMALVSWIMIPMLKYVWDADFSAVIRAVVLFFLFSAFGLFVAALVWHWLYNA